MHIDIKTRDGVVILKPVGDIIGDASTELRAMVDDQLHDASKYANVLFDFAECSRIDSIGIGVLAGLHVSTMRKRRQVGVINVGNNIKNLFLMARLITMFDHFSTESEAIVNLRRGEGS